ncbi:putative aarF domain-containing protein kinase 2, partial [Nibea albiflora]
MEELEKEDLREAWEIPGLRGVVSSVWQLWRGRREEEACDERSHPVVQHEESGEEKGRLIPVAIKIDLRFEAKNMERFRDNFRNMDHVRFPTPLRPFVTRNILVETFEESDPVSNYLSSDIPQEVKQRIAKIGIDTILKMVFVDNFVHADLHPGNILVQCCGPLPGSSDSTGTSGEAHGKTTLT